MFVAGQSFGKYTLVRQLGKGAYGEVWLAMRQSKFVTTKVAIKLPLSDRIDFEAIRQEAILWEQASGHPNVVPIIEADEYDGQVVIVSEYASDGSLEDYISRHERVPVRRAIEIAIGIADGLIFLHSRRMIHRDIKPANILLQDRTPRLTDFGMSHIVLGDGAASKVGGTPYYMAPEALSRKRSRQTDIWSFGVVLYEMLTGRMPFGGEDIDEIYAAILSSPPLPFPDDVPRPVQRLVLKALAKSPEKRYQTVAAMRDDLLSCLPEAGESSPESLHETAAERTSRREKQSIFKRTAFLSKAVRAASVRRIGKRSAAVAAVAVLAVTALVFGGFLLASPGPEPVPFRSGAKFGYESRDRKMLTEARYDVARPFAGSRALVGIGTTDAEGRFAGKFGFVDRSGREAIPLSFDDAREFSEDLAAVKFNGRWGFVDESGAAAIPFSYEDAGSFRAGLAAVRINGLIGFINRTGALVIPFRYSDAEAIGAGLWRVRTTDGTEYYIDRHGTEFNRPRIAAN